MIHNSPLEPENLNESNVLGPNIRNESNEENMVTILIDPSRLNGTQGLIDINKSRGQNRSNGPNEHNRLKEFSALSEINGTDKNGTLYMYKNVPRTAFAIVEVN